MQIVQAGIPFSFNYTAFDQQTGLFVKFSIYDVTSGTPALVTKVAANYANFGVYSGTYIPQAGKFYLIIGAVYTDGTYSVIDTTRSPNSGVWQEVSASGAFLPFAYTAYDQDAGLFIKGSLYDATSGTPVFVTAAPLVYLFAGTYFGHFTGTNGHAYQIASVVYTDGTYLTVDTTRSPNCDSLDSNTSIVSTSQEAKPNVIGVVFDYDETSGRPVAIAF